MGKKRKRIAAAGALCGGVLIIDSAVCPLPDFLKGLLVGMAIALLVLNMLPEKVLERLKEWKRHGG